MVRRNTKGTTLRTNIFLAVLAAMLAGMLLSVCFIAAEADHDCSGEDCPICVFLTLCEQNIRQLKTVLILLPLFFFRLTESSAQAFSQTFLLRVFTPVSLKIQLNN
ncbi:MAG: hypothetical protein IJI14_20565 [Anaerolineaceae bacterium]|nr:hypothetical protein [Anaerolineaceae bacterium]